MADVITNELDALMDLDPLEYTKNPGALDEIIAFHRKKRAEREAGGPRTRTKAVKDSGAGSALGALVKEMVGAQKPAGPVVKRRI